MRGSLSRSWVTGLLLAASLAGCRATVEEPTSETLARAVRTSLPEEPAYTYHTWLKEGPVHRPRRDPQAEPESGETAVAEGWNLILSSAAGEALSETVLDFQDYLHTSMGVRVGLEKREALHGWREWEKAIVIGTAEELPGCGTELEKSKDYRIVSSPRQVAVCGYDEAGARFGVYHLEARMNLREAPYLPSNLDTLRRSLYRTRMVLNWLGWMEWPDSYLSHLAHDGFDAIFASVYANPNGAPGPSLLESDLYSNLLFRNKRQDPERVRDLVRRASRFRIKIYAPILYRYTGEPANEDGLRTLVRQIVHEFPEIRGYILLTEGFYYGTWFGAGGHGGQDLREWARNWVRAVSIVAEECHRIDPQIEVLPWEYNIDFRPQQAELKAWVVSLLPQDTIPLLTWENGKSFELDGLRGYLRDYSINQVGPAKVTEAQIAEAKRRGMPVYAKVDTFASWQFGTTPYIPAPYQWYERYQALERYGVAGTHESWSNGYKPNFMTEVRAWYCWTDAPPLEELLRQIARREFGPESPELVLQAWKAFSEAIRLVPDTGPSMGTNFAVANPLFYRLPEPRTMMLEHSWRDPEMWRGYLGATVNPYWPYTHIRMVFFPDFTNRENLAETYARRWSGIGRLEPEEKLAGIRVLPVFNKYLLRAADTLEEGLQSYRKAALAAPERKRRSALKEVLIAEQMQRMLRSTQAILEFEDLRFRLAGGVSADEAAEIRRRMGELLQEEGKRTRLALEAALRDSRLGYEFEQDYVYTPYVLEEKLRLLERTLQELSSP